MVKWIRKHCVPGMVRKFKFGDAAQMSARRRILSRIKNKSPRFLCIRAEGYEITHSDHYPHSAQSATMRAAEVPASSTGISWCLLDRHAEIGGKAKTPENVTAERCPGAVLRA